jgi:hypothetical protein
MKFKRTYSLVRANKHKNQEVSLAHLVREVDVQPSHPGSSPHRREFGFLFSKKQNRCRGFPYRISFQKKRLATYMMSTCFNMKLCFNY